MKNCEKCQDLNLEVKIRSPLELRKAIKVVKGNLADGTITQINMSLYNFFDIQDDGPWNEILDYSFQCTACNRIFELSVETYHGSGGSWRPKSELN